MTFHYTDAASFQMGINLAGEIAVFLKITEGTGYTSPAFASQLANAKTHNVWAGAYHFLLQGNAVEQAKYCHQQLAAQSRPKIPVMVDTEPRQMNAPEMTRKESRTAFEAAVQEIGAKGLGSASTNTELTAAGWSLPTVADTVTFASWMQRLGHPTHMDYHPHWYWQQQGSPSLAAIGHLNMLLVSSNYTTYSDTGPGWDSYGGIKVAVWQHTDSYNLNGMTVDRNASRGSLSPSQKVTFEEFKAVARTGRQPSLLQYSEITGAPVSTILHWTLDDHKFFPEWLSLYLQAGDLSKPMRFGTIITTVKP